jgi:hypothetical protein
LRNRAHKSRRRSSPRKKGAIQKKSAPKAKKSAKAAAPKKEAKTRRAQKGATLAEIMKTTGWQKHTVRGFVSILASKGGQKIESPKNAAGERSYRIAK